MKRKGYNFRRAPHLTWRPADPKRDVGKDGTHIPTNYCVPVRCLDTNAVGNIKDAPCLPGLAHSRTNMAYGQWRKQNRGKYFWVRTKPALNPADFKIAEARMNNPEGWEQHWIDPYWTCPVYWIEDGTVWVSTAYRQTDPDE